MASSRSVSHVPRGVNSHKPMQRHGGVKSVTLLLCSGCGCVVASYVVGDGAAGLVGHGVGSFVGVVMAWGCEGVKRFDRHPSAT